MLSLKMLHAKYVLPVLPVEAFRFITTTFSAGMYNIVNLQMSIFPIALTWSGKEAENSSSFFFILIHKICNDRNRLRKYFFVEKFSSK